MNNIKRNQGYVYQVGIFELQRAFATILNLVCFQLQLWAYCKAVLYKIKQFLSKRQSSDCPFENVSSLES